MKIMAYNNDDLMDKIFYALSNTTRRNILLQLTKNDLTVNQIAEKYDMTLQGVSKHIHVLVSAGLVSQRKEGRTKYCKFNQDHFHTISELLDRYTDFWDKRLEALDEYFENRKKKED
ncbi:MAG: metalloregulator ArsR/SmtB family transcription factor [Thermodesulfobacteriota bacterium]